MNYQKYNNQNLTLGHFITLYILMLFPFPTLGIHSSSFLCSIQQAFFIHRLFYPKIQPMYYFT